MDNAYAIVFIRGERPVIEPNRHRKPWVRWLASWDWMDIPTWTMPQPSTITPTALMMEKIKGSPLPYNILSKCVSI